MTAAAAHTGPMFRSTSATLTVGGRRLRTTSVYDTYWRFAHARQEIFHRRVEGLAPPWTDDPIIAAHRFTNAYRAADRVSQFLISNVIYAGSTDPSETLFRTLMFKVFNRLETWQHLTDTLGEIEWKSYRFETYAKALDALSASGQSIYSPAYIMPSPPFGFARKHRNHLRLIELMMKDGLAARIQEAKTLAGVYELLLSYPSLGPFLAFQFTIDINYGPISNFSEMDFVVAGPGARDGIRKCFEDTAGFDEADIIRIMAERAGIEFARLGLPFRNLWGRDLQLIDCQNLFCEVDKYARVAHPEYSGDSGRTRIKQKFAARARSVPQWYPPKWNIRPPSGGVGPSRGPIERRARQYPLLGCE
ncbi:MAG: hypothetical protein J0L92_19095 [Deltaproteobacteria bacterium]|nr:hypothetical protein [Deltaproteobacteria bacterium]